VPATSCCWKLATASADGRLIEAANLQIDEAPLTGESQAVEKSQRKPGRYRAAARPGRPAQHRLHGHDRHLRARYAAVTGTGAKTQLGTIATLLQRVEKVRTPLQERLEKRVFTSPWRRWRCVCLSLSLALCAAKRARRCC